MAPQRTSTATISNRHAEREPTVKLTKGSPDARFMDSPTPHKAATRPGGVMVVATVESPEQRSVAAMTAFSSAIVVEARPSALQAIPRAEFDGQIEDAMDYSPISNVAAPDHPAEVWPEGSGPLGF